MADRESFNQADIDKEREQASLDRLQQLIMQRARNSPVTAKPFDLKDGDWRNVDPAALYDKEKAMGTVHTQDPNGGAQEVGVQEYIMSERQPLDPSTLRQDWGDAGSRATGGGHSASSPESPRDFSLDRTVRKERDNYVARDGLGDEETVPEDAVPTYLMDMDQGPAYTPGDEETKQLMIKRLREEAEKSNTLASRKVSP